MKKIFLLLTVLVFIVAVGFLSSEVVSASACDTDRFTEECVEEICSPENVTCDPRTCQNSGSNTSSNCTEPACVPLCQDSLFDEVRAECLNYANDTGPWEQNRIVKVTEEYEDCMVGGYYGCIIGVRYSVTYYLAGNVCSTSDKCATDECGEGHPSVTPLLNYGYCNCSVGSSYKICCNQEGDGYSKTDAIADSDRVQDDIDPEEGVCSWTSKTIYCVGWTPDDDDCNQGGPICPVPPIIDLRLGGDSSKKSTTLDPEESIDITWSASNARSCYSSDLNTGGNTNGSYTVSASDLEPRDEPYTYEITCEQKYSEYSGGFRENSITMSDSKEVLIYVADDFGCPDESLFSSVDGSTLYIQDTGSSCIAYCSRCSNNPDQLGNMATWTDDNWDMEGGIICDDGWDDVEYDPDPVCAFDVDINASPLSITKGSTAVISWSTDRANNCSISVDPSDPTSPNITGSVPSGGSETAGPFNTEGNYVYTLSCAYSANPSVTKSDSVTVNVGSSGGCTANLTANPSSITSGQSSNLSWNTSGASSCSINQGIGSVSTSGSRSVSPSSTTTYTLSCSAVSGSPCSSSATVSVSAGSCYSGLRSVSTNVSTSRDCLPYHPNGNNPSPEVRQTTINWSGSVSNVCSSIIGGGSPSNRSISCSDTSSNWNFSRSGSSSISGSETDTPTSTQTYSASCTRDSYRCTDYNTFDGYGSRNDDECEDSCDYLEGRYDAITSCSCSSGSCDVRWNSSSNPSGSHCTSWTQCPYDTICTRQVFVGYDPITYQPIFEPEEYDCVKYEDCEPCLSYSCRYYEYDQTVRSGEICSSSDSDSQLIRFIKKPSDPNLDTSPSKPQILLNQLINLIWSVGKPSSGVPTTLKCTPSISIGDGTGWVFPTGNMDRLNSFGDIKDLQPQAITDYEVTCRNRDNTDPLHCYQDSDTESYEVKVFEPYLEEKSPSFKDNFLNLIGFISEGLKKTLN